MKNKSIIFSILIVAGIAFSTFLFNSCEKKENIAIDNNTTEDILKFNSIEEYLSTLKEVNSYDETEREIWEDSRGFRSLGRINDEFYASVNFEQFNNLEELKNFVSSHSEFLKIEYDDNGEMMIETSDCDNLDRYLVNQNGMFQIGQKVYKVIDDQKISVDINHVKELQAVNKENIESYKNNSNFTFLKSEVSTNDYQLKDAAYNCGTYDQDFTQNGKNRIVMKLYLVYLDTYDINGYPMTILNNEVEIKNQKRTLGAWFNEKHTTSYNLNVAVDAETTSGWVRNKAKTSGTKSIRKWQWTIEGGVISIGYWARYNMHYGGYDCWADQPSTDPVDLKCNTSIAH